MTDSGHCAEVGFVRPAAAPSSLALIWYANAENVGKEPKVPNAALCTNVRCPKYGQKRVVIKPRSAKGMRHTIYEGFFSESSSGNKDRL
jgi:hypothetical protein